MRPDHEPAIRAVKLIESLIAARERKEAAKLEALDKDRAAIDGCGVPDLDVDSGLEGRYVALRDRLQTGWDTGESFSPSSRERLGSGDLSSESPRGAHTLGANHCQMHPPSGGGSFCRLLQEPGE